MRFIELPDVDWLRGYISSATYKADQARMIQILERDAAGFDWVGDPPSAPPADEGEADTDEPPPPKGTTPD
jgi:hypothetical protein